MWMNTFTVSSFSHLLLRVAFDVYSSFQPSYLG